ncbi:MAG: hypothetical protein QM764_02585 [Chitinophagaceae bacterium]
MRKTLFPRLFLFPAIVFLLFSFAACRKNNTANTRKYTIYTPVLKVKSEVLAAINGDAARRVSATGKLYIKDNFIYLNEVDKGIHVIDNSDRSHPSQVAFLDIPGNRDIAIRGNTLYADMYADLLAIDISNPKKAVVKNRLSNFFTERIYVNNTVVDSSMVAVAWKTRDTTVQAEIFDGCPNCDILTFNATGPVPAMSSDKSNGTAGSMAAMVLINDYLYAVSERHTLSVVNISQTENPVLKNSFFAGFDLETIYPFENKLFMGSQIGLFMYDVSNPESPVQLGQFSHGRACDPVVTDGNYAYVTLHAGTTCGGDANELNIVDVKDLMNPVLVKTYPLTKPTGLSKDGDILFVCDDADGVRVYNASNPDNLKLLQQIESNEPYDVIAGNNHLMVVAKDGLYQYNYNKLGTVRKLSFISTR